MTGRETGRRQDVRRCTGLVAVLATLAIAPSAGGQAIWPYRAAVLEPAPYYTDPQVDRERVQTPSLSYPALSRELVQMLIDDPRFEPLEDTALAEAAIPESEIGLGNDYRDLGIDQFSQYEILSAIDNLERAARFYIQSGAHLTHPREVASAYEYLARAYLERAHLEPDEEPRWVAEARRYFRDMIRLNPNAAIREGLFPPAVVSQFQQAYSELLLDDGRALALNDNSIGVLLERHDLEVLVYPFFIRDASGVRMVLEVYTRQGLRLDAREGLPHRWVVPLPRDQDTAIEQINRTFSRFLACTVLRYEPPPPEPPGDAGRFFLQAGWGAGVYGERPTERQFFSQGVGLTLDYHLTDHLGVFGRANIMFGSRDPDGDLLSGFTSTRTALGVALSARLRRLRVYLGTGLELNFVGAFTASDDFWCKVTGGRFETFGVGQDCLPIEVDQQDAVTLVGPYLMPGATIDILGPFGAYLIGSFAFYINSAASDIDFPLGAEAGVEYRF